MEDTRSFKEKSFQTNVDAALDKLTDLEFYRLNNYLNSTFLRDKPDEKQIEFLDEIFGIENWTAYIDEYDNYFLSRKGVSCKTILPSLKEYLFFKLNHRFIDLLSDNGNTKLELSNTKIKTIDLEVEVAKAKLKEANLRLDIAKAIELSYDDGIFYKDDGWINLAEVLKKNKLIKKKLK